jgi:A/G-specific adenine glycosylase
MAWRGMGYNNRAVRLHRLARYVLTHYHGRIPRTYDELISLPGVGKYTANALLSSAFNAQLPVVDVNVRRVLSRVFWRMRTTVQMRSESEIWGLATVLLPRKHAYAFNQALMDIGATVCTARLPRCSDCPVATLCTSRPAIKPARRRHKTSEPSLGGIPNRIYRGRVVEALRQRKGNAGISAAKLGSVIYPAFSRKNHGWMRRLLAGLERDDLVKIRGNGSIAAQRVALA